MTKKGKEKPEQKKEETEIKEEKTEVKSKPAKFKFECTRCGTCCQNRGPIPVTFNDIARWTKEGSFMSIILPHLELRSISEDDELGKIAIIPYIKMKDEDETGIGVCPFYDDENKMCNVYFSIPIFCKTFPLSFNGEKYYITDPTCEGIGKGEMTKEKLLEMRKFATQDFSERSDTTLAMIPLQGMFIRHFMKQTQQSVENLSEEDQKALDDLIKKSKEHDDEKPTEESSVKED
ncbi:MAG: YkgJ family cysteine cluster protein [Candidatus Heimdallarchaeota archaeon]